MTPTKIEWADYVWNPVTGCLNGCDYCYARRMAQRLGGRFGYPADDPFKPTFHEDRLDEPSKVKKPSRVFVCSMGDLFGPWVPDTWTGEVLNVVEANPQHTFIILTKQPKHMINWVFPKNAWCGVSAENQERLTQMTDLLLFSRRLTRIRVIVASIEPIHSRIQKIPPFLDWVIIGAETGNRKGRIIPESDWIKEITWWADFHGIRIFHKDNLAPYYEGELRREFPKS